MRILFSQLIFCCVLLTLPLPAVAQQGFEEILKAIVKIRATIPEDARTANILGKEREGHGVVIDSDGHVLTIGYLILEAESVEMIGPNEKSTSATVVGYDHSTGFGLIRAQKPVGIKPIQLGNSSELKEGAPILVVGYGGKDAIQAARIVSQRAFAGYWEYLIENAIFTVPPISNFGGAALIGPDGRLLGIGSLFTQITVQGMGSIPCNMFVPIDLLKPILNDLKTFGRTRAPSEPWLGLHAEEVHGRVIVIRTTPDGPAEKAGIKNGDVVLTVKGKPVKGLADFYRKVWALGNAGIEVPLNILQEIQIREIIIHSGDRYRYFKLKPIKRVDAIVSFN
ncbi:MAG: serine protease [Desulfobacterales bacterium]|nr:MAG: serine protease [Desulfobacterales bacterium]UCD89819.1 MAG: serine protease [Desulfobacterales bacterium]